MNNIQVKKMSCSKAVYLVKNDSHESRNWLNFYLCPIVIFFFFSENSVFDQSENSDRFLLSRMYLSQYKGRL